MTTDDTVKGLLNSDLETARAIERVDACVERFVYAPTLVNLCSTLLAMDSVVQAKGYLHSFGPAIEWRVSDGSVELCVRRADDDYTHMPFRDNPSAFSTTEQIAAVKRFVGELKAMLTHDEHKRVKWRQKLADLVQEGETLNIGMEFVAMLKATAEKMSTNIITHRHDDLT